MARLRQSVSLDNVGVSRRICLDRGMSSLFFESWVGRTYGFVYFTHFTHFIHFTGLAASPVPTSHGSLLRLLQGPVAGNARSIACGGRPEPVAGSRQLCLRTRAMWQQASQALEAIIFLSSAELRCRHQRNQRQQTERGRASDRREVTRNMRRL